MDISAEIAAIQAASQGSELRQPLVGALNKLNSGSLPAVTASDAGKILKVGANGWEAGEKSGYMPIPSATKQITENGTYDVTDYSSAVVNVSGGGGGGGDVQNWNEPLFRNWDFTNPLNTRGQTHYSGYMASTINGWSINSGDYVDVVNGGINLYTDSYYNLLNVTSYDNTILANNNVTLTLLANNEMASTTFKINTTNGFQNKAVLNEVELNINRDSSSRLAMWIKCKDVNVLLQGVKLEFGNTQTLAKQVNGAWQLIKHQDLVEEEYFAKKFLVNF